MRYPTGFWPIFYNCQQVAFADLKAQTKTMFKTTPIEKSIQIINEIISSDIEISSSNFKQALDYLKEHKKYLNDRIPVTFEESVDQDLLYEDIRRIVHKHIMGNSVWTKEMTAEEREEVIKDNEYHLMVHLLANLEIIDKKFCHTLSQALILPLKLSLQEGKRSRMRSEYNVNNAKYILINAANDPVFYLLPKKEDKNIIQCSLYTLNSEITEPEDLLPSNIFNFIRQTLILRTPLSSSNSRENYYNIKSHITSTLRTLKSFNFKSSLWLKNSIRDKLNYWKEYYKAEYKNLEGKEDLIKLKNLETNKIYHIK